MRAGLDFTHLVTFEDGAPAGNISWALHRLDGTEIAAGAVVPGVGAVSAVITVPAVNNQLSAGALRNLRELTWSYPTAAGVLLGMIEYTIEGRVPLPASVAGVREKLGVTASDLPDAEIDLLGAYWELQTKGDIASFENLETAEAQIVASGLEALAALLLLDTLQIRIAQRESSGTNEYARGKIDWSALRARLQATVDKAIDLLNPIEAGTAGYGAVFLLATGPDDFTG